MTALICKPPLVLRRPTQDPAPTLFLAGSIEMGVAEDWQARLSAKVADSFSVIYNPRRDDWDDSWVQELANPQFNAQVNWELEQIQQANYVAFYFDPTTQSPITLMELGLCAALKPDHTVVCCPDGYWRKGNVDVVCNRFGVTMVESQDELACALNLTGKAAKSSREGR